MSELGLTDCLFCWKRLLFGGSTIAAAYIRHSKVATALMTSRTADKIINSVFVDSLLFSWYIIINILNLRRPYCSESIIL